MSETKKYRKPLRNYSQANYNDKVIYCVITC